MDEGSEHPTGPEELLNGERIGKCFASVSHVYKHIYKVLFRKNHKASVWKIILQIVWQASVTTCDAIGCGICRDKLNHLAIAR